MSSVPPTSAQLTAAISNVFPLSHVGLSLIDSLPALGLTNSN